MSKPRNRPVQRWPMPGECGYKPGTSKSAATRRELRELKEQAGRLAVLCGIVKPLRYRKRIRAAIRILRTGSIV